MNGRRDPVKKSMDTFQKPRTFRDRKKHPSKKEELRDHPLHRPYEREHTNWTKEALDAEDIFRDETGYGGPDESESGDYGYHDDRQTSG